ncbi:helix-turn-helix domain-containing protein [Zoogloea sp.]|jgi:transcriptional regulator with XRE-family HTH domain|uniref:helix-turn-helix domain-containing protein n=1 Tax=Zoogloea sp. TaxID=49181 RepID=UPI002CA49D02|nr:helix-turn-helix transcriptional regulator [Zoogloea sp.]
MEERSVFARRLQAAREARCVSQKQLGILAGIDQFVASARINQYERGKHVPDLQTAQRLAAELNVPVSYLYEPDDDLAKLIRLLGECSRDQLHQLIIQLETA